ncbi:hypothetical protein F5X98DRAFT_388988 [Xylaria grammica]|nr:hypothetical protein F5X98DRAFT_388988 [Xylaria grammica]
MPVSVGRRPRNSKRSKTGCSECRRRKIKCDEEQPQCGQCRRRHHNCSLLDSQFRQVYPPSRTGVQKGSVASAASVTQSDTHNHSNSAASATHHDTPTATTIPNAVGSESPSLVPSPAERRLQQALPGTSASPLSSLSVAWHANPTVSPTHGTIARSKEVLTIESLNDSNTSGTLDPLISLPNSSPSDLANESIDVLKGTQQELFLLRHYAECIAPWMDLLYQYEVFNREVLTLVPDYPILRYAACAVAAKQLGQLSSTLASTLRGGKTQEAIALRFTLGQPGVSWYGAKYYEKAIQTLVKSITPTDTVPEYIYPPISLSQGNLMIQADREDPIVRLLATCLLIQYEQLSASRDAWSGHLTGFSKLLDLIGDGKLLRPNHIFEAVYPFTKDVMHLKAGFWNFVVNDLEESIVSHSHTRVDTENLALWRNMGLMIEDDGTLKMDDSVNSLSTTPEHARDKVLSYTLIRLVCKIVDYIAPSSLDDSLVQQLPAQPDIRKAAFVSLETQLDTWHRSLSPSFRADGTFSPIEKEQESPGLFGRELWFSNDLCSTTMLYYHMARILLHINRPSDLMPSSAGSTQSLDLLRVLRDMERTLQIHASEVFSIVQSKPSDAVLLRSIQPLYVAGRCCNRVCDMRLLVLMFREVENDIGVATEAENELRKTTNLTR